MTDKQSGETLTRNQTLVLEALSAAETAMTAYALLDVLRDSGLRAPPQVYRALERLRALGLVHRIESLNAFVACCHPDHDHAPATIFAICEDCGTVSEIENEAIAGRLETVAGEADFKLSRSAIELKGQCGDCTAK